MGSPVIQTIRSGVSFTPAAAASFRRCESDLGRRIDVNSTYRDWNKQWSMYVAWNAYVAGRGPYPGHSRAIHPDLSAHCLGLGLDSDDWTKPGFNAFMAERGWIRTAANDPTERHHFEYQSWRDKHTNRPAGDGFELIEEEEEDDMPKVLFAKEANGAELWGLVAPFGNRDYALPADLFSLQSNQKAYGTIDGLNGDQYRTLMTEQTRRDASLLESIKLTLPSAPAVAAEALATALAPLLVTGATVADIEAALADDFAGIPAAVRSAIIKD